MPSTPTPDADTHTRLIEAAEAVLLRPVLHPGVLVDAQALAALRDAIAAAEAALCARVEKLEEALEPFERLANNIPKTWPKEAPEVQLIVRDPVGSYVGYLLASDLRRARAALTDKDEACGEGGGAVKADTLIAVAAFRYALGRMTYMVSLVGDWLIANRAGIDPNSRDLIAREIDQAENSRGLGMEMDAEVWRNVRDAMRGQPSP